MTDNSHKYINPFTDYGFNKIFADPENKPLLLDFLNELLHKDQGTIVDLRYMEVDTSKAFNKSPSFNVICKTEDNQKFIVHLQKPTQQGLKDSSLYYSSLAIQEQANQADWNKELKAVYSISLIDCNFDNDPSSKRYQYTAMLMDKESGEVFSDKLQFIYFNMDKFSKNIEQLETRLDRWLYLLKNLHTFEQIPKELQEKKFFKLFETTRIAKFTDEQAREYEHSLKYYTELRSSLDNARNEGKMVGIEEGITTVARKALTMGLSIDEIVNLTGLSKSQIKELI